MFDDYHFIPEWLTEYSESHLGNGSIQGWYDEENQIVNITMQLGSDTKIGTGDWTFSIPSGFGILTIQGYAEAYSMGRSKHLGLCIYDPMRRLVTPLFRGTSSDTYSHYPVERYRPFTWNNGDKLRISINKL